MKQQWKQLGLRLLLLLSPGLLFGQYHIDWFRIGGGGGTATGGAYAVSSTIGQNGAAATGGPFALVSGYWALIGTLPTPGAPRLAIELIGDEVRVSWPVGPGDYVLQETDSLDNYPVVQWTDVPPPYTTNGARIFVSFPVRNSALQLGSGEQIQIPAKKVVKFRRR